MVLEVKMENFWIVILIEIWKNGFKINIWLI
jgi:hypothetical protein